MSPLADSLRPYADWAPVARIAILLACGVGLEVGARAVSRRYAAKLADATGGRERKERRQRAVTLINFATSVARVVIWSLVAIAALGELTINVGPILAGAGVVGAALAFGAQNVVKDYLAGFFILLEDQYAIGDVVKIGSASGTVEEITMRVTVLRAHDGAVHVVPHGSIQLVTNLTSAWSRTVVDVPVSRDAPLDVALAALAEAAAGAVADGALAPSLLAEPEVVGVVAIGEATATLRLQVKVVPEQRWHVERELLARVQRALAARGIGPCPLPRA